jgi:CheY-like chemotaxis protein
MSNPRARLLVVDDQPFIRTCLSKLLSDHGYGVRSARDGFSALAEMRKEIPDLIVSDLNMPGMSGFELLSVVRRRFPSIPVIAMSSQFSGVELPVGVAADAFYEKGVDPALLLEIVKNVTHPMTSHLIDQRRLPVPIWIPTNGHDPAREPYVMVICSECLRTFPQILGGNFGSIHETDCLYCHNPIKYAIVHSSVAA